MQMIDSETAGREMYALCHRLFPICRSITGNGVRETLRLISEQIPIGVHQVPTGTPVFDWDVPQEWNIRDAWIKNSAGEKLVDFKQLNLHVVSYSIPVRKTMTFAELKDHLFTVPEHPDWVPYRTSYYKEDWGFCLSQNQMARFREDEKYEVFIDSSLERGYLTYGEYMVKGAEPEEVLVSCHICHPSLANDNLSGISLAVWLARYVEATRRRHTYRFVFIPGTIGSITWLAKNEKAVPRIRHGLVLTCVGDAAPITYKRSRRGNASIDRAFAHVLKISGEPHRIIDFFPYGYDERQYCSPGFDLPVGCLMRSQHGQFPEYHTSGDNLDFIKIEALADSFAKSISVLDILDYDRVCVNRKPKCEPQLGSRGLYQGLGAGQRRRDQEMALLWVLNLSDGKHSLLDIADRANLPFNVISVAAESLAKTDLLEVIRN
jgi:aminopeptidase-like protein